MHLFDAVAIEREKNDQKPMTKNICLAIQHNIVKCDCERGMVCKNRVVVINFVVCNREEECIFTNTCC